MSWRHNPKYSDAGVSESADPTYAQEGTRRAVPVVNIRSVSAVLYAVAARTEAYSDPQTLRDTFSDLDGRFGQMQLDRAWEHLNFRAGERWEPAAEWWDRLDPTARADTLRQIAQEANR